ncbi:MAG: hypothetical protein WBB35_15415, partial [Saprospiraceae bacterium]
MDWTYYATSTYFRGASDCFFSFNSIFLLLKKNHMMDSARILLSSAFLIAATTLHSQSFEALQYRTVGPGRGGRVTTVTGTPIAPSTFYLGASGGGLWKTEDYGTSWH